MANDMHLEFLAKVFHLTIHPYIFHTVLVGKKCSDELKLKFLEIEDPYKA